MKPNTPQTDDVLKRSWSSASQQQIEIAGDRVLNRLRSQPDAAAGEPFEDLMRTPRFSFRRFAMVSAAAAVLLGVLAWTMRVPAEPEPGRLAVVEVPKGSLQRVRGDAAEFLNTGGSLDFGDLVRSIGDSGGFLALSDGSRIEMRAQTELSLESASDGVRIRLNSGSVIVSAAKQRTGHLYVQTKDMTVSVIGTVFLVNAEEEGSRVAVIEGEVLVQQGETSKKLTPGEKTATNPSMVSLPVKEEIAWSREAETHVALLQQSSPQPSPPRPAFAAATIRPTPFVDGELRQREGEDGAACRGIDMTGRGVSKVVGPGYAPINAPQGRCVAKDATLEQLVEFAYGRRIPRNPGFVRLPGSFDVEAVAENVSTVTAEQLRQMLQTMLTDRFKLRFRFEPREVTALGLVVGTSPTKLKLKRDSDSYEPPRQTWNEKGAVITGKSTLGDLAHILGNWYVGLASLAGTPSVVDKTGLTGVYDYEFVLPKRDVSSLGAGPRGQGGAAPTPAPAINRAAAISAALEEQLGLRLQAQKVTTEIIVLEHAEMPAEN
jgi:uncharacterized protein (TIGR03435 family)